MIEDLRAVVIETALEIAHPVDVVFGHCRDHTNEIEWNPAMRRVAMITDGPSAPDPVRDGVPPRPSHRRGVRAVRPTGLLGGGRLGQRHGVMVSGRVTVVLAGARLESRMEIETLGLLRAALPLLRRRMPRDLARDIALIKARLEEVRRGAG